MAKIKRFGVIKTSCFLGLGGVAVGLISAIILTVLANLIISALINYLLPNTGASFINISSIFVVSWKPFVYLPLIYGVLLFILGLIFTPIMNLILKIIKGLDLDIEMYEDHKAYQPPANYQPPTNHQPQNYQTQSYQQQNYSQY